MKMKYLRGSNIKLSKILAKIQMIIILKILNLSINHPKCLLHIPKRMKEYPEWDRVNRVPKVYIYLNDIYRYFLMFLINSVNWYSLNAVHLRTK